MAAGGPETRLEAARLAALPEAQQTAAGPGGQSVYAGTLLWSVLVAAGAVQQLSGDEKVRGVVRVFVRDGYMALFALGELDPDYAARPVLLAWLMNGAALPGDALRLLSPGERRGGRSVRDVTRIVVE